MKMKFAYCSTVFAVFAVAAGLTSQALAADPASFEPVIVEGAHDWSGLYVGGHIGYGQSRLDGAHDGTGDFLDGGGSFELEGDGITGGVQLGYNWQSGNFVYGIEGDISATDWSDSLLNGDGEYVSIDTDYVATLRARAGYAMDKTLVFATLGAAITDTEYYVADNFGDADPDDGSVDFDNLGVVFGGGVEYALNEKWSLKAEGLYFWFNDDQSTADLTDDSNTTDFADFRNAWVLRIGANYHF